MVAAHAVAKPWLANSLSSRIDRLKAAQQPRTQGALSAESAAQQTQAVASALSVQQAAGLTALMVPAPGAGSTAVAVCFQPQTSLGSVTPPAGATVNKVVTIDVFDPTTGQVELEHAQPPVLTITLANAPVDQLALCRSDPSRIAMLHVDSAGRITRLPGALDCDAGTITVRLSSTTLAVAVLDSGMSVPFRTLLGMLPKDRVRVPASARVPAPAPTPPR